MATAWHSISVSVRRLTDLLRDIDGRRIVLPQFHRGFVWTDELRVELFQSLLHGVPIGSLVLLKTWRLQIAPSRAPDPFPAVGEVSGREASFLLDGFQRLATLHGALSPRGQEDPFWALAYDLHTGEISAPRNDDFSRNRVPLWELIDLRGLVGLRERLIREGRESDMERLFSVSETLQESQVPVVEISTDRLDDVIDATLRMNVFGSPWSELDVLRVSTHSRERDVVSELEEVRESLGPLGWGDIDPNVLLDVAKIAAGIDFDRAPVGWTATALAERSNIADSILPAVQRAVRFLSEECAVAGPRMLPYRWQLVLLAEVARRREADLSSDVAARLHRWFLQTTYAAYFSVASARKLRSALDDVLRLASGEAEDAPPGMDRFIEPISFLRGGTARTTAFLLFLASLRPASLEGTLPAAQMLANAGVNATSRLFHTRDFPAGTDPGGILVRSVENRWLLPVDLGAAVRAAIARGEGTAAIPIDRLLDGHAFSAEAARCLANGDVQGTLSARRAELVRREKAFVESFGLSLLGA